MKYYQQNEAKPDAVQCNNQHKVVKNCTPNHTCFLEKRLF
jgi:hypothetical protein